jgi:hypothetical protein
MSRLVLYCGCPLCGQNVKTLEWLKGISDRPISIAHIARFARRSIERRELSLGEAAPDEAVVTIRVDGQDKPVFAPAGGMLAPPGWSELLRTQLRRAANALGFQLSEQPNLNDPQLTKREFQALARSYISEAEDEINLRKSDVAAAQKARGW